MIEDDRLRMYGYFGGPIVIEKTNVYSCRYRLYHGNMRQPRHVLLEIRDREFHEIDVWRS